MPTTTNFGWTTPADTDLVKDGALAIRTLGNGIDTSMVDLKGGTTGQNLRKASNTDMDFTWAGDATNTVVDAAGDLLYGTSADTLGRLAIGTAGQVLKVNSGGTAPEWGAAGGGTFVGCRLTDSGTMNISNATTTARTFDTETFDTDGFHSTSSNTSRITIPSGKGGYYLFTATGQFSDNTPTTGRRVISIRKNGTTVITNAELWPGGTTGIYVGASLSAIINGAVGDYFEMTYLQTNGGTLSTAGTENFACQYLGA